MSAESQTWSTSVSALLCFGVKTKSSYTDVGLESCHLLRVKRATWSRDHQKCIGRSSSGIWFIFLGIHLVDENLKWVFSWTSIILIAMLEWGICRPSHFGYSWPTHIASNLLIMTLIENVHVVNLFAGISGLSGHNLIYHAWAVLI